ncbi:hypothetical protein U8335_03955 [Roseiconus lacunae]|uniref:hypothetical protein n=1 Tax=Roseiconus lacunae TaxID=2605694 RepID=UPI0030918E74|nr:hypothetical protein U8335_03955 [Stieleria sp. HD01]
MRWINSFATRTRNMTATGTTTRPETWREKIANDWFLGKVADNMLQIDKDDRRQRLTERLIKKTQDGTLGKPTTEPMDGDDMGVSVGNEINYHYSQPAAQPAPAPAASPATSIAKTVAAAGLALAGLGTGTALPIAAYNLTKPAADAVVERIETPRPDPAPAPTIDTDTRYGLQIYRGE